MLDRADDDRNGVLDSAEIESLFRFVCQANTVPPRVAAMIKAADTDGDALISRGKQAIVRWLLRMHLSFHMRLWIMAGLADEFFALCKEDRELLAPVFTLQARARDKVRQVEFECHWH